MKLNEGVYQKLTVSGGMGFKKNSSPPPNITLNGMAPLDILSIALNCPLTLLVTMIMQAFRHALWFITKKD